MADWDDPAVSWDDDVFWDESQGPAPPPPPPVCTEVAVPSYTPALVAFNEPLERTGS